MTADEKSFSKGPHESVDDVQHISDMEQKAILRRIDLWYVAVLRPRLDTYLRIFSGRPNLTLVVIVCFP